MLSMPECKEVNEGQVVIEDHDAATLRVFWSYLLFNDLNKALATKDSSLRKSFELVLNLGALADKYDIAGLKQVSQTWLRDEMNPANALRIIKVASLTNAEELVEFGVKFVHANRKDKNLSPDKILSDDMPREISVKLMEMSL